MNDSLKKRYFYKLFTNFFGVFIGFMTQLIIPRGLGPQSYGNFNFLINFFTQLKGFFEMGTPMCFYTKLSQRPKENKLVAFYFYFMAVISVMCVGFVAMAHAGGVNAVLWPEQAMPYVYLASFLVIITWITQIMDQMNDAYGLTVPSEVGKAFQKVFGLILAAGLFITNRMNLLNIFFYYFIVSFLLITSYVLITEHNGYSIFSGWRLRIEEIKDYFKEFYDYSHPLFTYALVGLLVGILDRWLLQVFGGGVQQGFFSLAFQTCAMCFLFSGAMTALITREFSIAYAGKDLALMAKIFRKHIPLLYSITALLACFVSMNAGKITIILGGERYKDASLAVAIMAFYPIHQTYGQLSNSVFYATGQTRLYRNTQIIFNLIGLPLAFFLIMPKKYLGLDAGANGLALKMVLINIFAVNAQLYFNAKFLKLPFLRYIKHQGYSVICFVITALAANMAVRYFFDAQTNVVASLLLSGVFYLVLICFMSYYVPEIYGLKKADIKSIIGLITKK